MGSGIAHVAARAGHPVYLFDLDAAATQRGKAAIEKDLRFLVGKGRLPEAECSATLDRVQPISQLEDGADSSLVIEAIVERLDIKQALFKQLEERLGPDAILATNTSSLSITALGAALKRPERLVGMHFFNPAPRMALVEIVTGLATDAALAQTIEETARAWGKITARARSTPGFIVNRVARPYYAEALRALNEGAADPATLDAVLRECGGFPMGPLELIDMIGHDVNFAVTCSVHDAYFGDKRFTPSLIQQELVLAGRYGRKTGQGFYSYANNAPKPRARDEAPGTPETRIRVVGDLGVAASLAERLEQAGVVVEREGSDGSEGGAGYLEIGAARLALSDGRTATRRAIEDNCANLVLFDLALDYAGAKRIAIAAADSCSPDACAAVVGTLQRAFPAVSRIDDVAGLLVLRTVAMLANEAADAVLQGVANPIDVDNAMRHGTNYPEGPLAWAERVGVTRIVEILRNLGQHYGEERYRISPLLQRHALNRRSLFA